MAATMTVTLDCADPERLAVFWNAVLGYQEVARAGSYILLGLADGTPKFVLQRVPEARTGKNRMHPDIWVSDVDAEADRVEALGATRVQEKPFEENGLRWFQMADPEGNEFCVASSSLAETTNDPAAPTASQY